jgi:hypothetical protein
VARSFGRAVTAAGLSAWLVLQWSSRCRGASAAERALPLAGDDLVADAQVQVTRAATLPAPPAEVWPWLVKMGWGRAGWYTQSWADRRLLPANRPSVDVLLPDCQDLAVGDFVPDGPPDADCGFFVAELEPGRSLVLHSTSHLPRAWRQHGWASVDWTWTFSLRAVEGGRCTRLVFRWRSRTWPFWLTTAVQGLVVPADWVMSQGMLRGLSRHVSGRAPAHRTGRAATPAGGRC